MFGKLFPSARETCRYPEGRFWRNSAACIPTVSDRIAQMVVKRYLEPILESVFDKDSYGYRPGKSAHDASPWPDAVVGITTGCWIWTSKVLRRNRLGLLMLAVRRHTGCKWYFSIYNGGWRRR